MSLWKIEAAIKDAGAWTRDAAEYLASLIPNDATKEEIARSLWLSEINRMRLTLIRIDQQLAAVMGQGFHDALQEEERMMDDAEARADAQSY